MGVSRYGTRRGMMNSKEALQIRKLAKSNHTHHFPRRGLQKDYRTDRVFGTEVSCWFVHNSGKGFIDGHYKDYFVPQLYSFLQRP